VFLSTSKNLLRAIIHIEGTDTSTTTKYISTDEKDISAGYQAMFVDTTGWGIQQNLIWNPSSESFVLDSVEYTSKDWPTDTGFWYIDTTKAFIGIGSGTLGSLDSTITTAKGIEITSVGTKIIGDLEVTGNLLADISVGDYDFENTGTIYYDTASRWLARISSDGTDGGSLANTGLYYDTSSSGLYIGGVNKTVIRVDTTDIITVWPTEAIVASRLIVDYNDDIDLVGVSGSLIVGGSGTGAHLAFDINEIMAKSDATTATNLALQNEGGSVLMSNATSVTIPATAASSDTNKFLALDTVTIKYRTGEELADDIGLPDYVLVGVTQFFQEQSNEYAGGLATSWTNTGINAKLTELFDTEEADYFLVQWKLNSSWDATTCYWRLIDLDDSNSPLVGSYTFMADDSWQFKLGNVGMTSVSEITSGHRYQMNYYSSSSGNSARCNCVNILWYKKRDAT